MCGGLGRVHRVHVHALPAGCTCMLVDLLVAALRPHHPRQVDKVLLEVAGETLAQMAAAPKQQKQVGCGSGSPMKSSALRRPLHLLCAVLCCCSSERVLAVRRCWCRRRCRGEKSRQSSFSSSSRKKRRWRTCMRGWQQSRGEAAPCIVRSETSCTS